jgi:predicted membrane metal-binding protein
MAGLLWLVLVVILVLWLIGLLASVGGSLIHLLLVVALVVLIINPFGAPFCGDIG